MNRILISLFFFFLISNQSMSEENIMILKLKDGDVKIELFEDVAPNHVNRIKELANSGKYDGVVFHRVIDGFMAQTGDVKFGNSSSDDFNLNRAGMGGSELPDLKEQINTNLKENIYTDSSDEYLKILKQYRMEPTDLKHQIKDTYKGLSLLL